MWPIWANEAHDVCGVVWIVNKSPQKLAWCSILVLDKQVTTIRGWEELLSSCDFDIFPNYSMVV